MEIYPLAITQVDWPTFIRTCQDVIGQSPTRGLDACSLGMEDPAAYLGCLNLENDPLRSCDPSFRHFQISFIAALDEESLLLLTSTDLTITAKKGRRDFLVILSATADVWIQTALHSCTTSRPYELRAMLCVIVAHLERGGFRHLFSNYKKRQQPDGTFIIEH